MFIVRLTHPSSLLLLASAAGFSDDDDEPPLVAVDLELAAAVEALALVDLVEELFFSVAGVTSAVSFFAASSCSFVRDLKPSG